MKTDRQAARANPRPPQTPTPLPALLLGLALWVATPSASASQVTLWDTGAPLANPAAITDRGGWKAVPSDLFALEKDPLKAASDPGYYGREYVFAGDAVIENSGLAAVFSSKTGRAVLFSKTGKGGSPAAKIAELMPLQDPPPANPGIHRCEVVRNVADEVVIAAWFALEGTNEASMTFTFGKTGTLEIQPGPGVQGVRCVGPIAYGLAPAFVGDDLLINPADHPADRNLSVPADNLFLALVQGEGSEWVLTWPPAHQALRLNLGGDGANRTVDSVDFGTDGRSLYFTTLAAPGIWHRETLAANYLEKDVKAAWQRPFPARWRTQLDEAGVKTAFTFRPEKAEIWRGVPGSYAYPVWFEGEAAFFHLSKKVAPKGEALIYALEGEDTPPSIPTPVDILKETLGREVAQPLLDVVGRKLRTHHRRGGDGVRRACTCGATEAIQAVFEAGKECDQRGYVDGTVDDMLYFVSRHVARIDEYQRFAAEMSSYLRAQSAAVPELKPFIESLQAIVGRIPEEYAVQKENMKSPEYARGLAKQTMALTSTKDAKNLPAYTELGKAWRAMGGAQDYVLAECHVLVRQLFQEASSGALPLPKGLSLALEVRNRCRQCLRNPDGYEIWPNY